ncbi:hypothetical protein DPMN_115550 [Dreissena polymorpha]|uniref:Uncharacterized protein n=1 Tax=Dreissena polymorpha TaxID=45954 RepID=A0A9D4KLE0_DREPO|nr:hypothetical protein DPMN_115550 [Dreissena polymorpha]
MQLIQESIDNVEMNENVTSQEEFDSEFDELILKISSAFMTKKLQEKKAQLKKDEQHVEEISSEEEYVRISGYSVVVVSIRYIDSVLDFNTI